MKNRKLTGPWAGFSFENHALVTPEGRRLLPEDLAWLSLTAQLAQEYRRLLDDERQRRALPGTIPAYMRGAGKGVNGRKVVHRADPCPVIPLLPALKRSARA